MAQINPLSTSLRLILSAGTVDGKNVTKSVSVNGIDVNADANVLNSTAASLSTLLAHPRLEVRRNAVGLIVE